MKNFNDLFDIDGIDIIKSTQENSLIDSVKNPKSIISFPVIKKYEINNIELFQIYNDTLKFIDIPINESMVDIISDIQTTNVYKKLLLLNGICLTWIPERIIKCSGMYTEVKLRLFFYRNSIPDDFTISFIGYLIGDNETRQKIMRSSFIDNGLVYTNGMIMKE